MPLKNEIIKQGGAVLGGQVFPVAASGPTWISSTFIKSPMWPWTPEMLGERKISKAC